MKKLGLVLAIAAAFVCSNAHAQYQIDDGTSENSIGLTGGGTFAWGNMFATTDPTIDTLEVGFDGGVAVGTAINWFVFSDDDGNPTAGLTLLGSGSSTVMNNQHGTDGLTDSISTGSIDLTGGAFVFLAAEITHADGEFPAAIDQGPSAGVSWITLGTGNAADWGLQTTDVIDNFGLPGNWIIRGSASAIPEPATAGLLAMGLVGIVSRRRR